MTETILLSEWQSCTKERKSFLGITCQLQQSIKQNPIWIEKPFALKVFQGIANIQTQKSNI